MTNPLSMKSWRPSIVGVGIGVLSWFAFASADKPLGVSTAFEHSSALVGKIATDAENRNEYYAVKNDEGSPPKIGWEWMLVVGIFVGAMISSLLSGDRANAGVPSLWRQRFGNGVATRLLVAFLAGALMMVGARLAQGCTSGHGISGSLQLAVSSIVFISVAFGVAMATAFLVYGRQEARDV